MPGLFILKSEDKARGNKLTSALSKLCHEEWFETSVIKDSGLVLGKVSNGIFNVKQPAISTDSRFTVFIEGEIYNSDDLTIKLFRQYKYHLQFRAVWHSKAF